MDQNKILQLDFLTATGKNYILSIKDPKDDLERADVVSVMEDIIEADVFLTAQGESLESVNDCYYKTVTITPLTDSGGAE